MDKNTKILLVGCGKMGSAMLKGWLDNKHPKKNIHIIEKISANTLPATTYENPAEIEKGWKPDVIVFAIKPQEADFALPEYAKFTNALFISIMAGKSIASMQKHLGKKAAIVRAMPNLPASIGMGITAYVANKSVTAHQKEISYQLFNAFGTAIEVQKEAAMDAVTAISGSGPAYLFYFIECFVQAAKKVGLEEHTARVLAMATIRGSAGLVNEKLQNQNFNDIQQLRKDVTSKGGTTEAALDVLMDKKSGLLQLLTRAVNAAKNRSKSLSS